MSLETHDHQDDSESTLPSDGTEEPAAHLSSNIRVVIRVRPSLPFEKDHSVKLLSVLKPNKSISVEAASSESAYSREEGDSTTRRDFKFDDVYDGFTSQSDLFEQAKVSTLIESVIKGFHATIFAYGQTGSGKTYTMEGYEYETVKPNSRGELDQRSNPKPNMKNLPSERLGIVPRVIRDLFTEISKTRNNKAEKEIPKEYRVKCSFLQIYNEQVFDLLHPIHLNNSKSVNNKTIGQGLKLRYTAASGFYVQNLFITECRNSEEVLEYFHQGIQNKIMASHRMNKASSRSHCVFTIYTESWDPSKPDDIVTSKLTLVDLAGSERVSKTGAKGKTLQESIGINKSLFVLRQVIQVLSEQSCGKTRKTKAHVPYRDSKLTSILKHSLGGNSYTLMIACLSPSDNNIDENISTLTYASSAQAISNTPVKNEDPKTRLIRELRDEIRLLKNQLAQAQQIVLGLDVGPRSLQSVKINEDQSLHNSSLDTRLSQTKYNPSVHSASKEVTEKNNEKTSQVTHVPEQADPSKYLEKKQQLNPLNGLTEDLKKSIIENVALIKNMYKYETKLRQEVEKETAEKQSLAFENHQLNEENQSLREKIEVLEYLVATSANDNTETPEVEEPQGKKETGSISEIPGYGQIDEVDKSLLSAVPVPSKQRIHEILKDVKRQQDAHYEQKTEPQGDVKDNRQEFIPAGPSKDGTEQTPPPYDQLGLNQANSKQLLKKVKKRSRSKKQISEIPLELTGSLSLDDLKHLLGKSSKGNQETNSTAEKAAAILLSSSTLPLKTAEYSPRQRKNIRAQKANIKQTTVRTNITGKSPANNSHLESARARTFELPESMKRVTTTGRVLPLVNPNQLPGSSSSPGSNRLNRSFEYAASQEPQNAQTSDPIQNISELSKLLRNRASMKNKYP